MCFGSCTSIRPACSQCVGEPVTSVALPAVVEERQHRRPTSKGKAGWIVSLSATVSHSQSAKNGTRDRTGPRVASEICATDLCRPGVHGDDFTRHGWYDIRIVAGLLLSP